jgi:hypothetical protein
MVDDYISKPRRDDIMALEKAPPNMPAYFFSEINAFDNRLHECEA